MSNSTKLQGTSDIQNGGIPVKSNEDFSYLQQSQTGYGMQPTEPYIASYYGTAGQVPFPYMGEWSAGDSVPYLSGYNNDTQHAPPFIPDNNMFAPSTNLGNGSHQFFGHQPMFSQGNEFTAWGSTSIEPQNNQQQTPYNGDFYQQSIMQHSYLGAELLSNTSNDFQRYNTNVAIGNEITAKLPQVTEPTAPIAMNSLDQNFQSMNLEGGDAEKLPQKSESNSSMNIGLVQNGLSDTHENGNLKPPTSNEPSAPSKPISWAAIASKPAKPQPKPKRAPVQGLPPPAKHNMDIGTWDGPKPKDNANGQPQKRWNGQRQSHGRNYNNDKSNGQDRENHSHKTKPSTTSADPVLEKLITQNEYNPKKLILDTSKARFFVIKSYSEDDIHRSIKYNIWCSTEHGNKRLDTAFHDQQNRGPVVLLYSVNGSGHFCGVAEMKTKIDYSTSAGVWCQDKWKGSFTVKWIYVKDVPNAQLRHIKLENNENKPVTNSRDTQEVPLKKGREVLQIIASFKHQTSIFDDFGHYEKKQLVEEDHKTKSAVQRDPRKSDGNQQHGNNNRQRR